MRSLLQLIPEYHARVWGGQRLRAATPPIGEAWLIYEGNRLAAGPQAGQSLAALAEAHAVDLLGAAVVQRTGPRFPLLIKLLDCEDWLSIQVHPNDAQAVALEGPGHFGKTEAWHILEAAAGARLIAGVKPDTSPEALAAAIRSGQIEPHMQYHAAQTGDTVFIPAGTVHALGPGLLLYEVQQTSDITYRVFDWNRPASAGRALHLEQSAAVARPELNGQLTHLPPGPLAARHLLTECAYFHLERLNVGLQPLTLDTERASFHAVTIIAGQAEIECADMQVSLDRFESVIVPAAAGRYTVRARAGQSLALKASVPAG